MIKNDSEKNPALKEKTWTLHTMLTSGHPIIPSVQFR